MRCFETRGPVYPEENYVVARTDELSNFVNRLEKGRYIVLFAPRQTGKTTFFRSALDLLTSEAYFPIQIDFQSSNNLRTVLSDFLYTLRHIYISERHRCPYSAGIVGIKSITQLNYDRSISPFNIQDEFKLPNFTHDQVNELLSQYTDEVGQSFAAYVKFEKAVEGYYVVFDHRKEPEPRVETETLDNYTIRSYVIPVLQERPST